jgi:hypothetical protein
VLLKQASERVTSLATNPYPYLAMHPPLDEKSRHPSPYASFFIYLFSIHQVHARLQALARGKELVGHQKSLEHSSMVKAFEAINYLSL